MNILKSATGIAVAFVILLFMQGCKKDSDNDSNYVTDIDGNKYKTVKIGDQTWMAENLRVTHYSNGDTIAYFSEDDMTHFNGKGSYFDYNNEEYTKTYGRLYNAYILDDDDYIEEGLVDERSLCPCGWHIPAKSEVYTLAMHLGGYAVAGGKLKERDTIHWASPNISATNSSGFTALPGGYYDSYYDYAVSMRTFGGWLYKDIVNGYFLIKNDNAELYIYGVSETYYYAVRCIKDSK